MVAEPVQNPFGLRGGIEPERFVVPERLVREITEDIAKKQSVSIVGARMMGKTSLLKFLVSERCKPYYRDDSGQSPELRFAYIDLQEHSGKSRNELVPELARVISESLSAEKRFQGNTHSEALNWLKQTTGRRHTESPFWVLLFDEFDRIVELSGIDKTFFDELRSLPQHYNLCYVIASRRKLIDLPLPQGANTSPFFNFLKEHFLTVWDKPTTRTLMFKPRGTELGLFTEDDFAFISQLTAHHPLLLQIVCYYLFNVHRVGGVVDYDQLRHSYMREAESVYHYYYNYEINNVERGWLSDCWYALSRKDTATLQELQKNTIQRMNCTIYLKLEELGFILSESGNIELPTGFQSFLEMNPIPLTNLEALLCELNNIQERIRSDYGQFLTVLFTDIEGFTTWTQQFGDVASAARVQKHNDLLFPVVESHQGEVLKTIGDALLAVFEDAEKAVSAASKMQDILEKYNREEIEKSQRILIRCGLHTGYVMRFKRDVFGDTVNIAARIVSLASGGEIMMSAATYEKIKDRFGVLCAESGEYELKGIDDKVKVYKLQIGMAKIT